MDEALISSLKGWIEKSLVLLCEEDKTLFKVVTSEQSFCGALAIKMTRTIPKEYQDYYVDVEYNRGYEGQVKRVLRKDANDVKYLSDVTCDLVVHNRGEGKTDYENLIALEMKKTSDCRKKKKNSNSTKVEDDYERLKFLTTTDNNSKYGVYPWPKKGQKTKYATYGYPLGIFVELCDRYSNDIELPDGWRRKSISQIRCTYFIEGEEEKEFHITLSDNNIHRD